MAKLKIITSAVVLLVFLIGLNPSDASPERALEGVTTVNVLVENLPTAARRGLGMTSDKLHQSVSSRLRSLGVEVTPKTDYTVPTVYIRIGALHDDYLNRYSWNMTLQVRDVVYLTRISDMVVATTYEDGSYGNCSPSRLRESILGSVDEQVRKLAVALRDSNL